MAAQMIDQSSIQEILREYPEVIPVFIQLKTQCIGCAFERFCTLEDVSKHYEIPINELVEFLSRVIAKNQNRRGYET